MKLVYDEHNRLWPFNLCSDRFQASAIRRHISQSLRQRKGHFPCYYINEFATYTLPPGELITCTLWSSWFDIRTNILSEHSDIQCNSVITNEYFGPKCPFTTQIDPVIANRFGRSEAVLFNRVSLYMRIPRPVRILTPLLHVRIPRSVSYSAYSIWRCKCCIRDKVSEFSVKNESCLVVCLARIVLYRHQNF